MKLDKLIKTQLREGDGIWLALPYIRLCTSEGAARKYKSWKVDWTGHPYWIVVDRDKDRRITTGGDDLPHCLHVLADMLELPLD